LPFKDWVVTACFYAAVHLSEALFDILAPSGNHHAETTKPPSFRGGIHAWRGELINRLVRANRVSVNFFIFYRNFYIQSNISRYLIQPTGTFSNLRWNRINWRALNMLSDDYFSHNDINDFINKDLATLEREAGPYLSGISIPRDKRYNLLNILKNIFQR